MRYLIFLDDSEEHEYKFYLNETDIDTLGWTYTSRSYDGDEFNEVVALIQEYFGEGFTFSGTLVNTTGSITPPEGANDRIIFDTIMGHFSALLNYCKFPYEVYPTNDIGYICSNPSTFPDDTFLHLQGSDPEERRYIKFFTSQQTGNKVCQVYDSTKTAPIREYYWPVLTAFTNMRDFDKYAFTNFESFKNAASDTDASAYVRRQNLHVFDIDASTPSLHYAIYFIQQVAASNRSFSALWYILQSGADIHVDTGDDDPYAGDEGEYDPSDVGGGDGDGQDPYDDGDDIPYPDDPDYSVGDTGLLEIYIPSTAQLNLLAGYLWSSNFVDSMVKSLYADPMDVIISIGALPFTIPSAGSKNIKVGDRDSGVSSYYPSSGYFNFDCGSVRLKSVKGTYLDYAPYTKGELYLPYVGFIPLDVDAYMGKTISIKYKVDISNGSAIAFIMADNKVMQTFSCNMMLPIPLSAANYSEMWGSVLAATATLAGAGVASGAAMGGAATAAAKEGSAAASSTASTAAKMAKHPATQAASSIMNSAATKPEIQKSNNIGVSTGLLSVQYPFITLERPNACIPNNQNKIMGYPSYINSKLSELSGYTRVSQINLSVPSATASELSEIEEQLKAGVIISTGTAASGSGIVLYKNNSSKNTIGKNLTQVATLTGTFRDNIDIHNPVFTIEHDNPADFNYVYISDFGRVYYVTNVNVLRKGIIEVHCVCDVLNSFITEIKANTAIIDKQESKYNLYLNDDSLKVYQNPLISTWKFPYAFGATHTYVLLVAGD